MAALSTPASKDVRHFTSDFDLSTGALTELLDLAAHMKRSPARFAQSLAGRYLTLLFEKPSLRTRMTFELAIKQLGGDAVVSSGPIAEREPVKDVARNLDRWTHGIVARVFSQNTIDELAQWSAVPVINALSDRLSSLPGAGRRADAEGTFRAARRSEARLCRRWQQRRALVDADRGAPRRACRRRHAARLRSPIPRFRRQPRASAKSPSTNDPSEAVAGAHAVYTDVWASMGQESEAADRARVFAPYQVNEASIRAGAPRRRFHALPARQARPGSDRRRDGIAAIGGVRSGRKPPARAESAAADAARADRGRRSSSAQ